MAGWGARIRTWEWRNQNPLPYHLATPQQVPENRGQLSSRAARRTIAAPTRPINAHSFYT